MSEIVDRLRLIICSSCTCVTSSPKIEYHKDNCSYRLASDLIDRLMVVPEKHQLDQVDPYLGGEPVGGLLPGLNTNRRFYKQGWNDCIDVMLSAKLK